MSKAFTRESDDLMPEEVALPRVQLSPGVKNYITRQGADRLRQQIADLLEQKRSLASGAAEPDKATLRRVEAELVKLQHTLNSVTVADPPVDREKIAFGATVSVRDSDGEDETYQIVGVDEADPGEGRISASSPLAQALLNQRPGDKVRFRTPAGERELTILGIEF